jgi:hypothetical protein
MEFDQNSIISASEWIDIFNQQRADIIEFSGGGEPYKHPEILSILSGVPSKWAITSNTLNSKINETDLSKCCLWTASFHPQVSDKAKITFFNNIHFIASKVPTSVTLVATPQRIQETLQWANRIHNMGFRVNIHPYYDDREFSWYDYPNELAFLKRSKFVVYDEMMFKYSGYKSPRLCGAGNNYKMYGPDGKSYRCMSDLMFKRDSTEAVFCDNFCPFPCDWSQVIKDDRNI